MERFSPDASCSKQKPSQFNLLFLKILGGVCLARLGTYTYSCLPLGGRVNTGKAVRQPHEHISGHGPSCLWVSLAFPQETWEAGPTGRKLGPFKGTPSSPHPVSLFLASQLFHAPSLFYVVLLHLFDLSQPRLAVRALDLGIPLSYRLCLHASNCNLGAPLWDLGCMKPLSCMPTWGHLAGLHSQVTGGSVRGWCPCGFQQACHSWWTSPAGRLVIGWLGGRVATKWQDPTHMLRHSSPLPAKWYVVLIKQAMAIFPPQKGCLCRSLLSSPLSLSNWQRHLSLEVLNWNRLQ